MSTICSVCLTTVRKPDTIWYACTRFSWCAQWVCGTCIMKIPKDLREPANYPRLHDLSFGTLHATTNDKGVYQGMDSTQGPIVFWVTADGIEGIFPESCDLLHTLEPYYRIDEYLAMLAGKIRDGDFDGPEEQRPLMGTLSLFGRAAECFLTGCSPDEVRRKGCSPYTHQGEFTDEEIADAEELKQMILERYPG